LKKLTIRISSILSIGILTLGLFTGCQKTDGGNSGKGLGGADQTSYPLKTDVVLKYWMPNSAPILNVTEKGEFPWYKEYQKRTGVSLQFVYPPLGQEWQQWNIMLASGDIPDIVEYFWYNIPGGADKAINDGYVAAINPLLDKYAPNYKKFLDDNPQYNKMLKTDSGNYIGFGETVEPGFDKQMMAVSGYMIRKDWLDELGLAVPTTIDEWYTVLKAFKEKKGAEAPFCANLDYLGKGTAAAFGAPIGYYQENGKVKSGLLDPGFKDYLTTMAKWYSEGLIDKNFASNDGKMMDYAMTSGKSGLCFGWLGAHMGKYTTTVREKDPKFELVGLPYPTLKKGDTVKFAPFGSPVSGQCASISAKSKYKELAARMLDYNYTKDGAMFNNFGVENDDYKMDNGYPKFTDKILKNPQGLTLAQTTGFYMRASSPHPGWQDHRYLEQYYPLKEQKDALPIWGKIDYMSTILPTLSFTTDESSEMSKIGNSIDTNHQEMYTKFILGKEPLSNFDKYIEQLKKIGIDRAIEIQQNALDRYNKR